MPPLAEEPRLDRETVRQLRAGDRLYRDGKGYILRRQSAPLVWIAEEVRTGRGVRLLFERLESAGEDAGRLTTR